MRWTWYKKNNVKFALETISPYKLQPPVLPKRSSLQLFPCYYHCNFSLARLFTCTRHVSECNLSLSVCVCVCLCVCACVYVSCSVSAALVSSFNFSGGIHPVTALVPQCIGPGAILSVALLALQQQQQQCCSSYLCTAATATCLPTASPSRLQVASFAKRPPSNDPVHETTQTSDKRMT